jgi:hypothetical protein
METTPAPPSENVTQPGPTISWRSFPFLEKRLQGISVLVFILVILVGIWFWTYEWYMVALGGLFLFGSLASYFLPTRFTLSDEGVEMRRIGRQIKRGWSEFRSFYADKRGLMLSTFDRPSRMDAFRGFNIHFSGNRDAVIVYVEKHLPRV